MRILNNKLLNKSTVTARIAASASSITKPHRAILASLRQAELQEWLASGGDYLASMHQPVRYCHL